MSDYCRSGSAHGTAPARQPVVSILMQAPGVYNGASLMRTDMVFHVYTSSNVDMFSQTHRMRKLHYEQCYEQYRTQRSMQMQAKLGGHSLPFPFQNNPLTDVF